MRFVIHFVSVYSIIHPGGQRASNMPGTACDHVQQLWTKIFMRHFCVREKKNASPGIPVLLTGTHSESANRLTVDENGWTDRLTGESHTVLFLYLCVVSADIEEVEREDVVLGSHNESSSLLVQQEGVVG